MRKKPKTEVVPATAASGPVVGVDVVSARLYKLSWKSMVSVHIVVHYDPRSRD